MLFVSYVSPEFTEILTFKPQSQAAMLSNLLTGFLAIPGTLLAIAAILFAIIQMANRKITIIQLVFENSGVIPVVYWAIINSLFIIVLQLLGDSLDSDTSIRALVFCCYNFVLLMVSLLFTLYWTFRYLDYTNITDDYLKDINRLLKKELKPSKSEPDNQQLRQRGKEVYTEITDAIDKDDAVLVSKYLKSFDHALNTNPSSNYITDFNRNLAVWIVKSSQLRSRLFGPLVEFWRTQLSYKLNGTRNFIFSNIDNVPLIAYKLTEDNKSLKTFVTEALSLRLKEIVQFTYYKMSKDKELDQNANFDQLFPVFIEYSEVIKYLIEQSDLNSLKIVLNDIRMMRETFIDGTYSETTSRIIVNRSKGNPEEADIDTVSISRYRMVQKVIREIDMIIIGNLYWLYLQIFENKTITISIPELLAILNLLNGELRYEGTLENIVYLYNHEDNRMLWDNWIWNSEERLSGEVYTLFSISDIIAAGFAVSLVKQTFVNIERYSIPRIEELRNLLTRTREYVNKMSLAPVIWMNILTTDQQKLSTSIQSVLDLIGRLESNVENDFVNRLAEAEFSRAKVTAFKKIMQQQWENSRDLSRIFEHFGAIDINPQEKLVDAGDNINLKKGKVLFVEGDLYSFIHGMEFGSRVNNVIERRFAEKLSPLAVKNEDSELADIFERGISDLRFNGFKANAIFVDIRLFYENEMALSTTGKYTSVVNHVNPFDFAIAGIFNNNIPIFAIRSYAYDGLIALTELPKGMVMQQRQQQDYYGNNLIIEIEPIDRAKAEELVKKRRQQGDKADLSVTELMASVEIHIHQIFDFKLRDTKAINVYKSKIGNFGK